jgi:hypothetical protein
MHKTRELWTMRFKQYKNYTVETEIVLKRIILTAEPENIKAILATQFLDYGIVSHLLQDLTDLFDREGSRLS